MSFINNEAPKLQLVYCWPQHFSPFKVHHKQFRTDVNKLIFSLNNTILHAVVTQLCTYICCSQTSSGQATDLQNILNPIHDWHEWCDFQRTWSFMRAINGETMTMHPSSPSRMLKGNGNTAKHTVFPLPVGRLTNTSLPLTNATIDCSWCCVNIENPKRQAAFWIASIAEDISLTLSLLFVTV